MAHLPGTVFRNNESNSSDCRPVAKERSPSIILPLTIPREPGRSPSPLSQEKVIHFLFPAPVLSHGSASQCCTHPRPKSATEDGLREPMGAAAAARIEPPGASATVPPATRCLHSRNSPAERAEWAPSLTQSVETSQAPHTGGLVNYLVPSEGRENIQKAPVELARVIPRKHCLVPKKQRSNEGMPALPLPLYI